jgi:hypothetical protein
LGFAVGGAFLSAAYYPHLYVMSGIMVAVRRLSREQLAAGTQQQLVAAAVRPRIVAGAISPDWRPRAAFGIHSSGSAVGVSRDRK